MINIIFGCILGNIITIIVLAYLIYRFYKKNQIIINNKIQDYQSEFNKISNTINEINDKLNQIK